MILALVVCTHDDAPQDRVPPSTPPTLRGNILGTIRQLIWDNDNVHRENQWVSASDFEIMHFRFSVFDFLIFQDKHFGEMSR